MPIPNNQNYVALCYLYGELLFKFQRYGESVYFLDLAISLNPVLPSPYFERSEIFKLQKNFEAFHEYTNKALRYCYSSNLLARGFRNLGFYYIEQEELELATALFKFSLIYERNDIAYSELNYIESLGFDTSQINNNFIDILTKENIQIGPSDLVFNTIIELINEAQENNSFNDILPLYRILYDITKDNKILEIIDEIENGF